MKLGRIWIKYFGQEFLKVLFGGTFVFLVCWLMLAIIAAVLFPAYEATVFITAISVGVTLLAVLSFSSRIKLSHLLVFYIVNCPLYWISCLLPVRRNLWLFGSRQGTSFSENPKYFFLYICRHRPEIQALWITKSRKVLKLLRELELPCVYAYSPAGYYYSARAECVFFSHTKKMVTDFNDYVTTGKTLLIQLWHGTPMKKIGRTRPSEKTGFFQKLVSQGFRIIFPFLNNRFVYHRFLASSGETSRNFKSAFNLNDSNFLFCGYPKNDLWLERAGKTKVGSTRKVIYMPTWRNGNWLDDFRLVNDYDFNIFRLNSFCAEKSIDFFFRFHPYAMNKMQTFENEICQCSHLHIEHSDDIYEKLDDYDILISDYSSVIFDYLLSDRPVIYGWFDYTNYREKEGFFYESQDIVAGPIARNWLEIEEQIQNCLSGRGAMEEARARINLKFNEFHCSNNSERLYRLMEDVLQDSGVFREASQH